MAQEATKRSAIRSLDPRPVGSGRTGFANETATVRLTEMPAIEGRSEMRRSSGIAAAEQGNEDEDEGLRGGLLLRLVLAAAKSGQMSEVWALWREDAQSGHRSRFTTHDSQ